MFDSFGMSLYMDAIVSPRKIPTSRISRSEYVNISRLFVCFVFVHLFVCF